MEEYRRDDQADYASDYGEYVIGPSLSQQCQGSHRRLRSSSPLRTSANFIWTPRPHRYPSVACIIYGAMLAYGCVTEQSPAPRLCSMECNVSAAKRHYPH